MSPMVGGIYLGPHRVVRVIAAQELPNAAAKLLASGFRLALVAAHDDEFQVRVVYLFLAGGPDRRVELHLHLSADQPHLPSLAEQSFPAGRFEREMVDLFGISVDGHPAPRRLVKHAHWPAEWYPMRRDSTTPPPFPDTDRFPFVPVEGYGVYEIPVGPVHAGLIEPGHFRFSVVGETILKLTARLWFTHRGVEKLFEGRDALAGVDLAERISGDSAAAHSLAHCLAIEEALHIGVPEQVHRLRVLLVELERLYNHATDLGALANDVGLSIANVHTQRIREQLLRLNEAVTGHRLLRNAISPGGVSLLRLPDPATLRTIATDLAEITELTLANSVVRERFTATAILGAREAREIGCLGYVARASGIVVDARIDHPTIDLSVITAGSVDGDVLARYAVRRDEYAASTELACALIEDAGDALSVSAGPADSTGPHTGSTPERSGVGIVEGWRGTVVHRVEVDRDNRITRAKIVDPSWFNWPALPVALTDTIVADFPLANKSFNLSYAGNDL